jgi:hypothetical protein
MIRIFTLFSLLLLAICSVADDDPIDNAPDVTIDGLHRVADSNVDLLYLKPGADFSRFTRVFIVQPHVAFVEGYRQRMNRMNPRQPVTQADMDRMKEALSALLLEVFTEELQNNGGYVVVDGAADDVLALRPAILDLDVVAPETSPNQRSAIPSVGQMTLYMELIDSISGDVLAKVLDHKSDRTRVNINLRNRDRNEQAARRIVGDWATLLREGLDDAHRASREAAE